MLNIVLYQPQIPPNTGNIIRLCANTGANLHLIQPLGFTINEKSFKRAGLDYHHMASLKLYDSLSECLETFGSKMVFAVTKFGKALYSSANFHKDDVLVFGSETKGLPKTFLEQISVEKTLYIPMKEGNRSLNLSNAVALTVYEAWRQQGFTGYYSGQ
tara:strand:- start:695 stop:1168 length:474 start_codon:yes stop_codon:yes gene_type:complete